MCAVTLICIAIAPLTALILSAYPSNTHAKLCNDHRCIWLFVVQWKPPDAPIPVEVEGCILHRVIDYCTYHKEHAEDPNPEWNNSFCCVDDDTLFSTILAANYLEIKPLLDLSCQTVSSYIQCCRSNQEIRRRFNIKNDFTPEEEDQADKDTYMYLKRLIG